MSSLSDRERNVVDAVIGPEVRIDDHGEFKWWPKGRIEAAGATTLRLIADYLDDMNGKEEANAGKFE